MMTIITERYEHFAEYAATSKEVVAEKSPKEAKALTNDKYGRRGRS